MLDTVVCDLGREAVRTLSNCGMSFDFISPMKFAIERSAGTLQSPLEFFV